MTRTASVRSLPIEQPVTSRPTAGECLADAAWRENRRLASADWAASPTMQAKVRELLGGSRPPEAAPLKSLGRFQSGPRVVVVGRRTHGTPKVA